MSESKLGGLPALIFLMVLHHGRAGGEAPNNEDSLVVPGLAADVDPAAMNSIILANPPRPYMLHVSNEDGSGWTAYMPRIILDMDPPLGNVLGANTMTGHNFIFHMEEARIGIAESNCAYACAVHGHGRGEEGAGHCCCPLPSQRDPRSSRQQRRQRPEMPGGGRQGAPQLRKSQVLRALCPHYDQFFVLFLPPSPWDPCNSRQWRQQQHPEMPGGGWQGAPHLRKSQVPHNLCPHYGRVFVLFLLFTRRYNNKRNNKAGKEINSMISVSCGKA
jgi:hypothetical protein